PVATAVSSHLTPGHNQTYTTAQLSTASDPYNDPIAEYDVWNLGGGHFVLNNQVLGVNQDNFVLASQLSQLVYQSGSGADTLWVRAYEGGQWSAWSSGFTVTAPADSGPTAAPVSASLTATHNQTFTPAQLFTASDPFNDP